MDEKQELFNLSTPSLKNLSHVLRHKELWPGGFRWDYNQCTSCALGLAHELWIQKYNQRPYGTWMALKNLSIKFDMSEVCASLIFIFAHEANQVPSRSNVTPEMVADQIDAYLDCKQGEL